MAIKVAALALLVVVVAAAALPASTQATTCSPVELASCAPAIFSSSTTPSKDCCAKLKEQRPCLCSYKKNPALKSYVDSPGAQHVASYCGVTVQC